MSAVSIQHTPRGRNFVRGLIVRAANISRGNSEDEGIAIMARRWNYAEAPAIYKAAVAALVSSEVDPASREFAGVVRESSILGRLQARRVPFNVRTQRFTSGSRGYWVGQGKAIPLSHPAIAGSTLAPLKVAAIVVATRESLSVDEQLENALHLDLQRALTDAADEAFIDAGNAGVTDETPAAITYGATTIASTGDPAADIAAMIASFDGDLSAASFVTDPLTATQLALSRDAGGSFQFPDVGPRGGSILGIPVLTSRGSPVDSGGGQIALIDPMGIATQLDNVLVEPSGHATLEMSDTPTADASTGTGTTTVVSLFQTNSIAFKALISANWERQRSGGVVVLTGVVY